MIVHDGFGILHCGIKAKLKGMSPVQYRTQALVAAKYFVSNFLGSLHSRLSISLSSFGS